MPRSLHACMDEAYEIFQTIATPYSGEALRRAGELHAALQFGRIDVSSSTGCTSTSPSSWTACRTWASEVNRSFFNVAYA